MNDRPQKAYDFRCLGCGADIQALYSARETVHQCDICGQITKLTEALESSIPYA
jgi:ribosomal protein S27E